MLPGGATLPSITGGTAGPSYADGMFGGGLFDSSGWSVNFGAGSIAATRAQSQPGDLGQYLPWLLAAAGVVVVWRLSRKR